MSSQAETAVHPTAILDPSVELDEGVRIGPYCVIGPKVRIGRDTVLDAHVHIGGFTTMGERNRLFPYASVGAEPQDLKFSGEECWLEIGDDNQIREFCTFNRGTAVGGGTTRIGSHGLFMAYAHIAHDCVVGDRVVLTNNGTLGGHVEVQDWAVVGAFSSVHQFCRVGKHAYIGGYSVITQDVLPFGITVGEKPVCRGLNRIGLERRGFDKESLRHLEQAFRKLLRSKMNTAQALEAIAAADEAGHEEVQFLVDFVKSSERGVIKMRKAGSRGA